MTTKQIKTIKIKTFKVIHFSMKVVILQHNCIKRTTTKCPKGEGKSDIGSYFLIMEINTSLIQFSSVAQSCLTFCDPMNCSTPGLPVHHQLPEPAQTHVIFECPIFLPFHTVHGVLKSRIIKWSAFPFSSGPHFVRTLHHEPFILGGPTWHDS